MRIGVISSLFLLIFISQAALAQQSCPIGGSANAEGTSYCFSAVKDGNVQKLLFTCEKGVWTNTGVLCPDQYAYFCKVGPHAVAIGERLLLGSGPAFLECKFPGVLSISQGGASTSSPGVPPSGSVRNVQHFLSREKAGLDCTVDQCAGQVDDKTLSSVVAFVRKNFAKLDDKERTALGVAKPADTERILLSKSPIDVIPVFVAIFDVPKVD